MVISSGDMQTGEVSKKKTVDGFKPVFSAETGMTQTDESTFVMSVPDEISSQMENLRIEAQEEEDAFEKSTVRERELAFLHLDEQLRKRSYGEEKSLFKWKLRPSADMRAIFNAVDTFKGCMDRPLDARSFEQDLLSMQTAYVNIAAACESYKSSHDPGTREGKIRYELVDRMHQMVMEESKRMESSALYFRETAITEGHTWKDVVSNVRTINYKDRVKGGSVELTGAGTTAVYKLGDGAKTVYFKENEASPKGDFLDMAMAVHDKEVALVESGQVKPSRYYDLRREMLEIFINYLSSTYDDARAMLHQRFEGVIANGLVPDLFRDDNGRPIEAFLDLYKRCLKSKKNGDETELKVLTELVTELGKMHNLDSTCKAGGIAQGSDISVRNVLTSRLAQHMGISDIIAKSTSVTVNVEGKVMEGSAMEEAEGLTIPKIVKLPECQGKRLRYSPNALRQLNRLQIFDILCGQVDRHEGNFLCTYTVKENEVIIERLTGIDNDLSFGTLRYNDAVGYGSETKIRGIEGHRRGAGGKSEYFFKTPYIDLDFAYQIMLLTPQSLDLMTADVLKEDERQALHDRLKGLQACIQRAIAFKGKEGGRDMFVDDLQGWEAVRDSLETLPESEKSALVTASYLSAEAIRTSASQ